MESTALVRYREVKPPRTDPRQCLRVLFSRSNIVIQAREGFNWAFSGIDRVSLKLKEAIRQLKGVSLEIDELVALPPETLMTVLDYCKRVVTALGNDLKAITVAFDSHNGQIIVTPRTFSGDEKQLQECSRMRAYSQASLELDRELTSCTAKEDAEKHTARLLFKHFKIATFKVYDVASDGSVRLAYAFQPDGVGGAKKVAAREIRSHFADWVKPEDYYNEAMGKVLIEGRQNLLVANPSNSECCIKIGRDGRVTRYETTPFALIAEEVSGHVDRVYKLDWERGEDLAAYSGPALWGILKRVADFKKRSDAEQERGFLNDLTRIAAEKSDLNDVLEETSIRIAQYFDGLGGQPRDNKVTIMLFDQLSNALVTRVICARGQIKKVEYTESLDSPSIGTKLFQLGATTYLRKLADWKGEHVVWRNEGRGSLLGTVVLNKSGEKLGVIIVSSSAADAFTQDLVRILDGVSQRIAQPFERIIRSMEVLNLDTNFGVLHEGSVAKVLLPAEIRANHELLSKLFVDPMADNLIPRWEVEVLVEHIEKAVASVGLRKQFIAILHQALETKIAYKVYSKKYLLSRLQQDLVALNKKGYPVSTIFCDIDWFKQTNEGLGHEVADLILKEVLLRIHKANRDGEVYRYGGEETAVRLNVPLSVAERVAERMREAVAAPMEIKLFFANRLDAAKKMRELEDLKKSYPESGLVGMRVEEARNGAVHLVLKIRKTISLGVAEGKTDDTPESLIGRADSAQREAKREGRNRVKAAEK